MIKLAISGCLGRMGQAIIRLALKDKDLEISKLLEYSGHSKAGESISNVKISTDPEDIKGCNVLIEFTNPESTMQHLKKCVEHNIAMIIGTTGLDAAQINDIKEASKRIPIVFSSNMSVGVNLLFKLTQLAAEKTGMDYKIKITEAHHIHKKDAPSGTAKTIASLAAAASGNKVEDIESIREGEIIGDHTIQFESGEDILSISHHAKNRDIFAKGALVAAKFITGKKPGLFNMQDVLGLV